MCVYEQTFLTEVVIIMTVIVIVRVTIMTHHRLHDDHPDRSFYGIRKDYTC